MTGTLQVAILADADARAALRMLVADCGVAISVTVCSDLDAVLALLDESHCDALVLQMRDAGGIEVLERLREHTTTAALIVLLNEESPALRNRALAAGANDCLSPDERRPELLGYALRHGVAQARREPGHRERAAQLRRLFDFNPHPMWVCDAVSLKFLAVNACAVVAYGYSEAEFLSMTLTDLRVSDARTMADGAPSSSDAAGLWCHRRKRGGTIEVDVFAQALPQWGNDVFIAQARDVTAERRAMRGLEASERRFRDFFQHSMGFICIHDLDGIVLSVNPATASALGRSVAQLLGTPLRDLSPPEMRFLSDNYLQRIIANGEDAGLMRVVHRDGSVLEWQYSNRVYVDAEGSSYVMGHAQDITTMREVEQALQLSERRLRTVADTLPLKIAYLDDDLRLVFANEAFRQAYRLDGQEMGGMHVKDVIGADRFARRTPYLDQALAGERVVFEDEEGEADSYRCVEITFIPEAAGDGTGVIGVHAMVQDVTEKKREEKRLIHLARMDHLTGLMNRAAFYERLDEAIVRAGDGRSLLAVFYLDIDRFKQVNDTHGHAVGDSLIRAFSARLTHKVRASDAVSRLGGDEFTVVMEHVPDMKRVRTIAQKLVDAMAQPFELHEENLRVTVGASIGIAVCRGDPPDAAVLVAKADAMLYQAKESGRGTCRIETIGFVTEPDPA
ncbi:MAG: diguanylate cyclase [Dokdonella sp.]|uniref:diguanylate cyclase domain-containing protein n=1 Tax=Dokdonella sp. TaxID=2291710 RepID=UPI0032647EF4